jgi:paraquat-inducible protein B
MRVQHEVRRDHQAQELNQIHQKNQHLSSTLENVQRLLEERSNELAAQQTQAFKAGLEYNAVDENNQMLSIQVSLLRETLDHIQQEANETQ